MLRIKYYRAQQIKRSKITFEAETTAEGNDLDATARGMVEADAHLRTYQITDKNNEHAAVVAIDIL